MVNAARAFTQNKSDMETLSKEHVRQVVNTIWMQLVVTTAPDVIGSWGISRLSAKQIVRNINGYDFTMAALILNVDGFLFQGNVYVALDEGCDYYRIYFEKDGKLGFVDLDGKLVIPFYFERAYHFTQGLAAVRHQGLWGYIDTNGDVYLPFVFEFVSPFRWGRAEVVYNGNTSKVDLKGRCVKNCKGIIAWRDIEK